MPSASETMATEVTNGVLNRVRKAKRKVVMVYRYIDVSSRRRDCRAPVGSTTEHTELTETLRFHTFSRLPGTRMRTQVFRFFMEAEPMAVSRRMFVGGIAAALGYVGVGKEVDLFAQQGRGGRAGMPGARGMP